MPADTETQISTGRSDSDASDGGCSHGVVETAGGLGGGVGWVESAEAVKAALRVLINGEFDIVDASDAAERFEVFEDIRRLADVAVVKLVDEVQRSYVFADHGHASAKVMGAYVAKLSGGEAAGRDKTRRMLAGCSEIADAFFATDIGVDQIRLLGRVFANRRVRLAFIDQQGWFVAKANKLSFKKFERAVGDWVALNDADGTEPDDLAHQNRDGALIQDYFTKGWNLRANGPSLPGAAMREIWDAYIEAEFHKDHESAKAQFGADVATDQLARTDAQRRFDALAQIFADAANNPATSTATKIVHNIVWDAQTYEEMVARMAGATPKPFDIDKFRCATIDGWRIDPTAAFVDSLINSVRRVIIDAKSVTIDMGQARFFTGLARLAGQISHDECQWIGCHIPISKCQADHIIAHSRAGPTNPNNNAAFCRRHNRLKEAGYTVWRNQQTGQIHITTPTGTQIQ